MYQVLQLNKQTRKVMGGEENFVWGIYAVRKGVRWSVCRSDLMRNTFEKERGRDLVESSV